MSNLVLLPSIKLSAINVERIKKGISVNLSSKEITTYTAPEESFHYYSTQFDDLIKYTNQKPFKGISQAIVVLPELKLKNEYLNRVPDSLINDAIGINSYGRFFPLSRNTLNKKDYPAAESTRFNQYSILHPHASLVYYPYGFYSVHTGMGPINHLGFRIKNDFVELKDRQKEHLLICAFGGSTTWSQFCFEGETFCDVLEGMLNKHLGSTENKSKYKMATVLNFGTFAHLVFNELSTYLLYAQQLSPDIVIGHDGWNDLLNGLISDPFLMEKHKLTYTVVTENWARKISDFENPERSNNQITNLPNQIVDAYLEKKYQFRDICEKDNADFIPSLQPAAFSKQSLNLFEKEEIKKECSQKDALLFQQNIPPLYERLNHNINKDSDSQWLNFHEIFKAVDHSKVHFGDLVHTYPEGDKIIAENYFNRIKKQHQL